MGGSTYSNDTYNIRQASIKSAGYKSSFTYDADVKSGKTKAGVHKTLDPKGAKIRESRDSVEHPATLPIILANDLTGSMGEVPVTLQAHEPKLMGLFLRDKASGKRYIKDYYPAIMIAGIDDYEAQKNYGYDQGQGALQVGQFESGIEIDENLGNLWLTGNGGGNNGENYDLMLYFAARHTAHDHYDKRGKRGYLFIFGDELLFSHVDPEAVRDVIGDTIEAPIPIAQIIREAKRQYHVFWAIPNGHGSGIIGELKRLLGPENVRTFDPDKVCEMIVATVAMVEGNATADDLITDGVAGAKDRGALVALGSLSQVATVGATSLPDVPGVGRSIQRL